MVKVGLLAIVGTVGLLNSARLHGWQPRRMGTWRLFPGEAPSRRLIVAEAAVGAVLLLAAGLLADTPPARGSRAVLPTSSAAQSIYGTVDDLTVSASVTPNRPGFNGFRVQVASSIRPAPAPIAGVELKLTHRGTGLPIATSVALQEVQPGNYFSTANLSDPGTWLMTLVIRRSGKELEVPLKWSLASAARPVPVAPSGRRLAPIADATALALLLVALCAGVFVTARRRRRRANTDRGPEAVGSDGRSDPATEPSGEVETSGEAETREAGVAELAATGPKGHPR
jgi:hypothetical protein